MPSAPTRSRIGVVVVAAAAICLSVLFAPAQVGGPVDYATVVGNSMEPFLHRGDLVLTRPESSYRVQDVVLYRSPVLRRTVLHRIVAVRDGGYVFKGDHNDFVDPGLVTRNALIGRLWLGVPHVGSAIAWLGTPLHAAIVAALTAAMLLLGTAWTRDRRRRRGAARKRTKTGRAVFRHPAVVEGFLGAGTLLALSAVLIGIGFATPLHRKASLHGAYRQTGAFSYTAHTIRPNKAYPSGAAVTGQPLFLDLFRYGNLHFSYRFHSRFPHRVHGTIELKALISAQTSWRQLYTVKQVKTFAGDTAETGGVFDLKGLRALVGELEATSGTVGAQYTVVLQPIVRIEGVLHGTRLETTFSPLLPISVTKSILKLDIAPVSSFAITTTVPANADQLLAAALHPSRSGSMPVTAPNYLTLARYHVAVRIFRELGLGFGLLSLLSVLGVNFLFRRHADRSEEELVAARYGCTIVPVVALEQADGEAPTELPDFESLARLARYCERPILHDMRDDGNSYGIEEERRLYLYRVPATPRPVVSVAAARAVAAGRAPSKGDRSRRARLFRRIGVLFLLVVAASVSTSLTATNTVPVSRAGVSTQPIQVAQLAPPQCAGMALTNLIVATGTTTNGTAGNDLILGRGGSGSFSYFGLGGNDCIVVSGSAGATNTADGGTGTNVCVGSSDGNNSFTRC